MGHRAQNEVRVWETHGKRMGNSMGRAGMEAWPGLAWPSLAWPGLAWAGLAWAGLAWAGLAWPGLDLAGQPGLDLWAIGAGLGLEMPGLEGLAWASLAWPGLDWSGLG